MGSLAVSHRFSDADWLWGWQRQFWCLACSAVLSVAYCIITEEQDCLKWLGCYLYELIWHYCQRHVALGVFSTCVNAVLLPHKGFTDCLSEAFILSCCLLMVAVLDREVYVSGSLYINLAIFWKYIFLLFQYHGFVYGASFYIIIDHDTIRVNW